MLMVGGICFIVVFEILFLQMFRIREHSVRKNVYDGVYFRKVKNLHCTQCNSAIYGLHHRKKFAVLKRMSCQKGLWCIRVLIIKSQFYQKGSSRQTLLKNLLGGSFFSVKSRAYPCNFIKNGLQPRGFLPLVLQDSSFQIFGKFYMGLFCNSFTKKLHAFDLQTSSLKIRCLTKIYVSKHLLVSRTSSRHVLKMY